MPAGMVTTNVPVAATFNDMLEPATHLLTGTAVVDRKLLICAFAEKKLKAEQTANVFRRNLLIFFVFGT
jgi:hypothetical protein